MKNLIPPPRFLHVIGMARKEHKIGGIITDTMAKSLGVVVTNGSDLLVSIKPNDVVFFGIENANVVCIDEDGLNCMVYQDAVLGSVPESKVSEVFPEGLQKATAKVIDPSAPGIMTPQGLKLGNRG